MTQEDLFWRAIEADPSDMTVRLVFADWLDEQGDARGEGMRALAVMGKRADTWRQVEGEPCTFWPVSRRVFIASALPDDWWRLLPAGAQTADGAALPCNTLSRREVEDAAARAFALLPAARRAELLNPAGVLT